VTRPLRWAVVIVDLGPAVGHEQAGQQRALVVSYEADHASGMVAVCPISARTAKYPGEVVIREGHAGQTKDGVILCHRARTIDLSRVTAFEVAVRTPHVTDPEVRREVRPPRRATSGWTSRWLGMAPADRIRLSRRQTDYAGFHSGAIDDNSEEHREHDAARGERPCGRTNR